MNPSACKKMLLLAGVLLVGAGASHAQYLRTSYFMDGTSSRLQLNPGLQPTRGYVNFPLIGSFNLGASSNVLGTGDIIDVLDSGSDLFTNDDLYNRLKTDNRLNVNFNMDVLSFGWYKGQGFWSVNVGLRADVGASLPKNMFEYLRDADRFDMSNGGRLQGDITNMNLEMKAWAEVGVGYSRPINDKLTVGGRFKLLLGIAKAELAVDEFSMDMNLPDDPYNSTEWNRSSNYGGYATARAHVTTSIKGGGLSFNERNVIDGFDFDGGNFGIAGTGFGIDLGASYKLMDNLTLSASILDLGFLKWKKSNTTVASVDEDITIDRNNFEDYLDGDFLSMDRFNLTEDEEAASSEKTSLSSTLVLAGEYSLLNNKVSVGAMYSAYFTEPKTLNELTFMATVRPKNWLNAAVSYSPIQAGGKSLGLALKLGPVFLGTDYMFFGNNSKSVNAFFGLSFPLGAKKAKAI